MSNQIDPKFIQQSFITKESINLDLHSNLIAFRYEYDVGVGLDDLQRYQNKTYLVFLPYLLYQNNTKYNLIKLNIVECSDPKLNGFNCLDFSAVSNFTLTLSALQGILSRVFIFTYSCQDTDIYKTTIPNNCASLQEIENVFSSASSSFHTKLYTSQYNTTSQMIQVNYRNNYLNLLSDSFLLSVFKVQKQMTSVQSGAIIKKKSYYSSPIKYELQNQNFDRQKQIQKTGLQLIFQISIQMDEIVQYTQIQYHTFPEFLAVCNSTLTLLMCVGILARQFASQLIFQDIFLLFLLNIYQGTYQKMLKLDQQLIQNQDAVQQQNEKNIDNCFMDEEPEKIKSIRIPNFQAQEIQLLTRIKNKKEDQRANQSSIQGLKKNQTKQQQILLRSRQEQISDKAQSKKSNAKQQKPNFANMFDQSITQKIQKVIFGKWFRKNQYLKLQGLDPKAKEKIEQQVFKSMDILQIYRELIFLKKAILMLLSMQQLSALKQVGCSSEIHLNQIQNNNLKEKNYFEEIKQQDLSKVSCPIKILIDQIQFQNDNFEMKTDTQEDIQTINTNNDGDNKININQFSVIIKENKTSDYNNHCDNESLKRWTRALSVVFLINSCIIFLKFIGFFYDKRCVYLFRAQFLILLGMYICFLGIQIVYSSHCGKLSNVCQAFTIIFSIFFADNTGILLFIVFRALIG
ncbi:hypothetical protein ABPG72_017558 [Tetrahymena utriculariae]